MRHRIYGKQLSRTSEHRKAMLERVAEIDDRFSVSDVELDRAGFSYRRLYLRSSRD